MAENDRDKVAVAFRAWADRAVGGGIPSNATAFSFNVYEHDDSFAVELVGAPRYEPDNPDWACAEVFAYRDPLFEIPRSVAGTDWQQGLALVLELVRGYLRSGTSGQPLSRAKAVTVGFVDGDLNLVWADGAEVAPSDAAK